MELPQRQESTEFGSDEKLVAFIPNKNNFLIPNSVLSVSLYPKAGRGSGLGCDGSGLDKYGVATLKSVLTPDENRSIASMYERDDSFRSTIVMASHGSGRGEYKYWSYPLPEIVSDLRTFLYPPGRSS